MNVAELADYRKLLFEQIQERRAILKSLPTILSPWEEYERDVWARFPVESDDGNAFSLVTHRGSKWFYCADLPGYELDRPAQTNTCEGAMEEIDAIAKAMGVLWP